MMPGVEEITPREFKARQEAGTAPRLVDVREPHEYSICHIEGSELKPLGQISQWVHELDPDEEIVFQCHSGQRSAYACMLLQRAGFTNVKNLAGGIDQWAIEVDRQMPRY
jgi:rhodanese-related sulfurtransferase